MSAEAHFMRGNFVDAHIALEKAYTQIQGNGQESIALCCDFLAQRLSICIGNIYTAEFEWNATEGDDAYTQQTTVLHLIPISIGI